MGLLNDQNLEHMDQSEEVVGFTNDKAVDSGDEEQPVSSAPTCRHCGKPLVRIATETIGNIYKCEFCNRTYFPML